jgi:hypothetical protein
MKIVAQSLAVMLACAHLLTGASPAGAQANHLKCYKIKDPAPKATYMANLTGLAPENGCLIKVPAKELCVASTKVGVSPTPPGGGPTGGTAGTFLCYKIKCPRGAVTGVALQDQFGTRAVTPSTAKLLCAPAGVAGATTTTTLPLNQCGTAPTCGGTCPSGQVCDLIFQAPPASSGCVCVTGTMACSPSGTCATGECPNGTSCQTNPGPGGGCACVQTGP